MVIIELLDFHFPGDLVAFGVVLESDGEVSPLVELTEGSRLRRPLVVRAGCWRIRHLSSGWRS